MPARQRRPQPPTRWEIITSDQVARSRAAEGIVIAAAISEVARNIVNHATRGEIVLSGIHESSRLGIQVLARDEGPGIADIEQAMQYGYSSGKGMGVGLPGAKWLMDEFDIKSQVGKGTRVTMRKWVR